VIDEPLARGTTWVHALDARAKLAACLALSVVAAVAQRPEAPWVVLAVGLVLTASSRPPLRLFFARLAGVNVFVCFLWLVLPVTAPGDPWRSVWGLVITHQGVELAGLITLKTNAIFLCVLSLVATTPAPALAQAMAALRVPDKFAFLFLFAYRYLHVIAEEYGRLATAAKLRGFVPATNWHTYRSKAAMVAMVLVKSFDRSQRVYQAMVLRGFTGTFPSLDGLSAGRRDAAFGIGVALALGLAVGLELWWRGHGV